LLLSLTFCSKTDETTEPDPIPSIQRGDVSGTQFLASYTKSEIQQIIQSTGAVFPFNVTYAVEVVSIHYHTVGLNGNTMLCSGAIFIPVSDDPMPLLSIQHGTESKRDRVASEDPLVSTEGLIGLMTASIGYVTTLPDYPGFGISAIKHPYLHGKSLVPSVIDFIRAGKNYCRSNNKTLNGQIFLTGYSEGGYVSLLAQKAIEEQYTQEINLTAVAPLSGPYDLKGMIDSSFHSGTYPTNAYVAYFFSAYDHIYQWNRLDELFHSPYDQKVQSLFSGSYTWGEIIQQLPDSFEELIRSGFVENYLAGNEPEFVAALAENTQLNWAPKTPVNFFHGDNDREVPYFHALNAMDAFLKQGSTHIQLTTIPGGTHESTGPFAIVGMLEWLEEFR
jgi:pimeloyl-ACP methyl ester carboxylesterase